MAGKPVRIATVIVEPLLIPHHGHERYRVTLECGCSWWEDCVEPPTVGLVAQCFAPHMQHRLPLVSQRGAVAADHARVVVFDQRK